jgi:hypothetical protein
LKTAGEKIFSEGDYSFPFYIIVASDETAEIAGVEVLKDAGGAERLMTRLHRGTASFKAVCFTAPFRFLSSDPLPILTANATISITGQYFGQKYFLTKQRRVRSATVRVPFDSVSVDIACLMPEQFSIWDSYRNVLLGKHVRRIQYCMNRAGLQSRACLIESIEELHLDIISHLH